MKRNRIIAAFALLMAVLTVFAAACSKQNADPKDVFSKNRKIDQSIPEKAEIKGGKYLVLITRRELSRQKTAASLMEEYGYDLDLYEDSEDESLDWDGYREAYRNVLKKLYDEAAEEFINENELDRSDIVYTNSYTGSICMYAAPEVILRCAGSDSVTAILPFDDSLEETETAGD